MTWNYQVIHHDLDPKDEYLALHEVYYDEEGKVIRWTENPVPFMGNTLAGLMETLLVAHVDARRWPVLRESELMKLLDGSPARTQYCQHRWRAGGKEEERR